MPLAELLGPPGSSRFADVHGLFDHNNNEENAMDHDDFEMQEQGDSNADAFAAVVLISVFVAACIFWIAGQ